MKEFFDPLKDFYKMRGFKEIVQMFSGPIILGIVVLILEYFINVKQGVVLLDVFQDFTNQLITVTALFISFSMAYLSIILTSESENIKDLKKADSKKYKINNKFCKLYQVLVVEITYTIVAEIIFLLSIVASKICAYMVLDKYIIIMIILEIVFFSHNLLMTLLIVKNMYFSFWKAK